ncbi:MAG: RNA polymerase sigma factor [Acidimicrobiia bacterium]
MAQRSGYTDSEALAAVVPLAPPVPAYLDFDRFYREQLPSIVALAAAVAGHAVAEEIAQEALLRAHRDWARIGRYDKPGAWVRRVAINLATSQRRRRVSERRALARVAQRPTLPSPPPNVDGFWALVRQLPPRQAAAVALHYLDDLSIADLAAALDCAEGTAKAHLHKARQTLARHLAHEETSR